MISLPNFQPIAWPVLAWFTVAVTSLVAPAVALVLLADAISPASVTGPILAIGLMGAGMIGAAAARNLWFGIVFALLTGAGLLIIAGAFGLPIMIRLLPIGLAILIAGFSFAARGALFACSGEAKGWWIAVGVVAGEAAILITAAIDPDLWPDWLLVLLPAQWANMAIQSALMEQGALAATSALIALGGTAAATLLVVRLWPRRWPYLVMFTTWIAMAALVWHWPA